MGISVSVDSWIEQTLIDLGEKKYDQKDVIYTSLIAAATNTSEIFLVPADVFKTIVKDAKGNLQHILLRSLEGLNDPDPQQRINSAALLSKIFPFMINNNNGLDLLSFLYSEQMICGDKVSPADYIITIAINTLISFSSTQYADIKLRVEQTEEIFDLLAFTVFAILKYYNNQTLYHSLIVYCISKGVEVIEPLLNYIHAGGRAIALVALFGILLFHPSNDFAEPVKAFIANGGIISNNLLQIYADDSDLLCYIASIGVEDEKVVVPSKSITESRLYRLSLLKILVDGEPFNANYIDLYNIIFQFNSMLAKYVYSKTPNITQDYLQSCPKLTNLSFSMPKTQQWFLKWVTQSISELFLYIQSSWFEGTDLKIETPSFECLEQLVVYNSA